MKTIKPVLLCFFLSLLSVVFLAATAAAQVVTEPSAAPLLPDNIKLILAVLVGLYEVCARLIPTVKNVSILTWLFGFISMVVPNNKLSIKGDETHD